MNRIEEAKERYNNLTKKSKQILEEYHLKGWIFKKVCEDIRSHLDGVVTGVLGEMMKDESVTIHSLFIEDDGAYTKAILKWKDGKVTEVAARGRRSSVSFIITPKGSQGIFFTKTNRILIPLRA